MSMLNIDFLIKRLVHVVKRNPLVAAWYFVRKSHMMMVLLKRCKCVHNKLFAVSVNCIVILCDVKKYLTLWEFVFTHRGMGESDWWFAHYIIIGLLIDFFLNMQSLFRALNLHSIHNLFKMHTYLNSFMFKFIGIYLISVQDVHCAYIVLMYSMYVLYVCGFNTTFCLFLNLCFTQLNRRVCLKSVKSHWFHVQQMGGWNFLL